MGYSATDRPVGEIRAPAEPFMKKLGIALALCVVACLAAGATLLALLRPPRLEVPELRDRIFHDVRLIEAGQAPRPGRTLRITDGRIASVEATPAAGMGTADAASVALRGLDVTPGLIDMHVHYPPAVAIGNRELWSLLFLAHGVTSVRETGSVDGRIFEVRAAIERGDAPGPRIFACGEILDGRPPTFPSNRVVTTVRAARVAVRDQAARGADCIKVYNSLRVEELAAIVEEARTQRLPVVGHLPHAASFEDAALMDLQHGTGAVVVDRERVGVLDFRWEDWQTVDDARIQHVAERSRQREISHTPTLVNTRMRQLMLDAPARDAALAQDTGLRHLPGFWVGVWETLWAPPHAPGDAAGAAAVAHFRARQVALAAGLHAGGARVHAGTDTLMPYVAPGSSLHGELAELVAAGLPVPAAWASATHEAGRWLGEAQLGTLEPGAPADLIFLRPGAPGEPPTPERIVAVLAAGRLYRRSDLDAALARFDAHFRGPLYRGVMSGVVRVAQRTFQR